MAVSEEQSWNDFHTNSNSAIHRGDYQSVLLEAAREAGADILTNAEVIGIAEGIGESFGKHMVVLKDGKSLVADVVVGADGIASLIVSWWFSNTPDRFVVWSQGTRSGSIVPACRDWRSCVSRDFHKGTFEVLQE